MTKINEILTRAKTHSDTIISREVNAWNKARQWPRLASDKAGELGLTGLYCPEEWGGQNLPLSEGIRVYEELGKGDGAYAFALSMHNICAFAVCGYATETFKSKWAAALTSGQKLANFSLTEPQSGSDAALMYTHAIVQPDGHYLINGAKAWVSLATEADVYLVVAKTSHTPGHKDMAMFAIPADTPGLRFGPLYDTPSYQFLPLSEMFLEDVLVPPENIILPPGQGLNGALMAIDIARTSIASGCCGLIQSALNMALRYAHSRQMFGKKSLQLDGIQWMLGDVATDLELSRLMYQKAADSLGGEEGSLMAAHAKRFVPDAALRATQVCTQVLGGMGLIKQYELDRLSRLAQMMKIVDGTTEIQRVVIGRSLQKKAAALPPLSTPNSPFKK